MAAVASQALLAHRGETIRTCSQPHARSVMAVLATVMHARLVLRAATAAALSMMIRQMPRQRGVTCDERRFA